MPDKTSDFTWLDENNQKLECTEKLRLLNENENELSQMTQDIFEDGIAMGVSKKCMNEAMKRLLLRLAASFSFFAFFTATLANAQEAQTPPSPAPAQSQSTTPSVPEFSPKTQADNTNDQTPATQAPISLGYRPSVPPTLLPAPSLYPADSWEGRSVGVIRILDRVNSETKELEIPVGAEINFHHLTIKLYTCNQKPKGLPADTAIRLSLSETPLAKTDTSEPSQTRQFEGWFLAAEPAVNVYPSPLYNVQAVRCAGDPVAPFLPELKKEAPPQPQPSSQPIPNQNASSQNPEQKETPHSISPVESVTPPAQTDPQDSNNNGTPVSPAPDAQPPQNTEAAPASSNETSASSESIASPSSDSKTSQELPPIDPQTTVAVGDAPALPPTEPKEVATLTPATPPPGVLALPFTSDQNSKEKKKHKHHKKHDKHGSSEENSQDFSGTDQ
ncbi:DUF2155 domain-containing protein [Acetobacteraceae bacterium]|nr:DUF2155 domain-containing protein [Acetobacteraceae bacterium]